MKIQKKSKDKLKAFKEKLKGIGLECTQVPGFQYVNKRTGKIVDVDAHERCFKKKIKGETVKVKKVPKEEAQETKDKVPKPEKKELSPLEKAIKANNGHPMSKTSDGKESILYKSILEQAGGDTELADKIKANVYSDEFKEWFGDWQNDTEFKDSNFKGKVLHTSEAGKIYKTVEQVQEGLKNGEILLHVRAADGSDFKKYGFDPSVGKWLKETESGQTFMEYNDGYHPELSFFADNDKWVGAISRHRGTEDIEVLVVDRGNPDIAQHLGWSDELQKDLGWVNSEGESVEYFETPLYDYDDPGFRETPPNVERGDFVTKENVEVLSVFKPEKSPSSQVIDMNGEPMMVYHGTTHEFDSFQTHRVNPENDLGSGFYFSNTLADVDANYDEIGPDLKNRIERRAQQIASDIDSNYDYDSEVWENAKYQATDEMYGGENITINAFVALKNPVILGGSDDTWLDYTYDEDSEIESGSLIDFAENFDWVARRHDVRGFGLDQIRSAIFEYPETRASDLISRIKKIPWEATDDNGNLVNNEVIRQAFELSGFDGFIDNTVNEKFGRGRKYGKPMNGVNADTKHIIMFNPTTANSIFSSDWTSSNANIYGTKISKVIAGTIYEGQTVREIMESKEGRKFLNENYF